jgi:hypothetical protein
MYEARQFCCRPHADAHHARRRRQERLEDLEWVQESREWPGNIPARLGLREATFERWLIDMRGEDVKTPPRPIVREVRNRLSFLKAEDAACREHRFLFALDHSSEDEVREMKAICAACPLRMACLQAALENKEDGTQEYAPIWGGMTVMERRKLRSLDAA